MNRYPHAMAKEVQFRYLSEEQQERIHQASLEILERIGVDLFDEQALALLNKAGARLVDSKHAHIPAKLVEWARSVAPRSFTLHNRQGEPALRLQEGNVYFGNGSDCPYILDHRSGQRRLGTTQDVVEVVRVSEALPNIDFLMSGTYPSDIPDDRANRFQMLAMLENSSKPIVFVTNDFESAVDAVKAAEVVAGGSQALRAKPNCACYINVTSPLRHNADALQKLLLMADKGVPATYMPVVLRGVNGPVTLAGAIALANAGELVGLVLAQLKREGAPVILSGGSNDLFDMRTMLGVYTAPENSGGRPAMARYYGLPTFGLGGASDAKVPDEQAAAEAALTLLSEGLIGQSLVHDVGYLESGKCYSLELLVMCNDLIGYVRRYLQGMQVSDESLALELIAEVGDQNDFLGHPHTARHFREDWYPRLLDRNNFENWSAAGGKTLRQRANARLNEILANHKPAPLQADLQRKIREILQ
jgi:trimethylamine--corrinoid protein Co-methyltransferase